MLSPRFLLLLILAAALPASAAPATPAVFTRYVDRTEGAFLLLVPKGWQTSGGMVRMNALTARGGAGNATDAKINFALLREPQGRVAIRWLPKVNYAQPSPYNAMLGGNWNGMPIVAMPRAADYLTRMVFPSLHPAARNVKVVEIAPRPDAVAGLQQSPVAQAMRSQGGRYIADAAMVTVTYDEAGERYKELLFVALEGYEMMGSGLWDNALTIVARAPEAEFAAYGPVVKVVINSFALNPRWLRAEMAGQDRNAKLVADTLRDLSRVDAEIARSRSETMSRINHQQYLTLTGQEQYRNPFSGEPELGSNEWKYRWTNAAGEPIYTDDEHWNPNTDPRLHLSGYKRTPVQSP